MNPFVLQSRTGSDGILHLDVPLGADLADREVRVVIEPLPKPMTQEEWTAYLASVVGSTTDPTFMPPDPGETP